VRFDPVVFTPDASTFKNQRCEGGRVTLINRDHCDVLNNWHHRRTGIKLHVRGQVRNRSNQRIIETVLTVVLPEMLFSSGWSTFSTGALRYYPFKQNIYGHTIKSRTSQYTLPSLRSEAIVRL
jgi:hypothetical protein